MSDCCAPITKPEPESSHCHPAKKKFDWLLWGSLVIVAVGYLAHVIGFAPSEKIHHFAMAEFEMMNKMWVGIAIGILFVGVLSKIPQEFILSVMGRPHTFRGIIQATIAGTLLDMCSHGILLVGMKLYKRGASIGQTMAFLISSPWNSLSLTIILITLIGLKWTLVFILFSIIIAVISGIIFDTLVEKNILPQNPNFVDMDENFSFFKRAKQDLSKAKFDFHFFKSLIIDGFADSKMIIKWLLFGIVIASTLRIVVTEDMFANLLGPTIKGMGWTLLFATIVEVCSEGATPIASDIVHRAGALGNGFIFLMAGVSTDYTEILSLKQTTGSWKLALFLPLVTVPQVLILGYLLNHFRL